MGITGLTEGVGVTNGGPPRKASKSAIPAAIRAVNEQGERLAQDGRSAGAAGEPGRFPAGGRRENLPPLVRDLIQRDPSYIVP